MITIEKAPFTAIVLLTEMAGSLASVFPLVFVTFIAYTLAFTGIFDFASQVLHDDSYGSAIGIINFGGQLGNIYCLYGRYTFRGASYLYCFA